MRKIVQSLISTLRIQSVRYLLKGMKRSLGNIMIDSEASNHLYPDSFQENSR